MRERDGTLGFVEVRVRRDGRFGGAAASIGIAKRQSLVFAASHFLRRLASPPPCRFDVVAVDGERIEWLRGAFDASRAVRPDAGPPRGRPCPRDSEQRKRGGFMTLAEIA